MLFVAEGNDRAFTTVLGQTEPEIFHFAEFRCYAQK
jgi:hypothetical protein